jgi:hypothetical protein
MNFGYDSYRQRVRELANLNEVKLPPKYVPPEAVFIVILWPCRRAPQQRDAVVVGLWIEVTPENWTLFRRFLVPNRGPEYTPLATRPRIRLG